MGNVTVVNGIVRDVLVGATTVQSGPSTFKTAPKSTFQAVVQGTGALTATVIIDASNDGDNWIATPLGTITLSGNDVVNDGFTTDAPWKFVRARVTVLTGTNATVNVKMGV